MNNVDFAVIGGDRRMSLLAEMLGKRGKCEHLLKNGELLPENITAETVILPIPCSFDGVLLNCAGNAPTLAELAARVNARYAFGGRIPEAVKTTLRARGATVCDLLEDEALLIKNALLTAEGALGIIISETSRAVLGSRILVFGYGRVGKALAHVLVPLGADVLVAARKPAQLAEAECDGCTPVPFSEASAYMGGVHVICNTAPACVLDKVASADAVFIELASGGYNAECAKKAGMRFINAQGLPGKTAPESAAKIIYDRITDLLMRQI